ncbi:hypothetical protein GF352_04765 [archaeon]|nr:hypothetical protein [archaeon]
MMISTGKVLSLFSLLILLSGARGLEACQCSTVTTELYFTNDESTVQHYTLQKSGLASTWSTLTPSTFTLDPGETKLVVVFLRVGCSVEEGVYDLVVKAVSEDGLISESVSFEVSSCRSVAVKPEIEPVACVNQGLLMPLNISNDGDYSESVNLTSSSGNLSISSLTLDSGDSQLVNLSLVPREVGLNPVIITASWSGGDSRSVISVNTTECSAFTASLSNGYVNLCESDEVVVKLTVTNDEEGKRFFFNSSSLLFDLLSNTYLEPNEVMVEDLVVYSSCESGVSEPVIRVWAEGAGVVELPLVLNVKGCYLPIVVARTQSDLACACEELVYYFDVYNPGFKEMIYAVTSSAGSVYHDGVRVDSITLDPDESITLSVNHSVPCGYSGSLNLSLTATSISACSKTSTSMVKLMVDSWTDCQAVSLQAQPVVSGFNESPFTVPVNVRNIGVRPTSYNLVVTGSAMSNLLGVSKSFVTLNPGESEVVELTLDPERITGSFISVQAFSTDNLASDSAVINFGESFLSDYDFYFLLIPSAVTVLLIILLVRSNLFNKSGGSINSSGKEIKIKKAERKK